MTTEEFEKKLQNPKIREVIYAILSSKPDKSKPVTERIKTLKDVFDHLDIHQDHMILLNYYGNDRKIIGAKNFMLAEMIAEALNEGWEADYTDTNQKKWYGWFDGLSGFAFSDSYYGSRGTFTTVGSRLCFKSEELLLHAVKCFPEVYKEIVQK